jgi:signal peptidase complex subunit 2
VIKTTGKDGKVKETKIEKSFAEWFDAAGHFVALPFQQMFASNVAVIGKADPKRIVTKVEAESMATPGKGAKRRGRKA